MIKIEKSIVIKAPLEEVFAYATEPRSLPDFWTGITEVSDVQRLPNGGYRFHFGIKQAGIRSDATAEYAEYVPNQHILEKTHGAGRESTLLLTFERLDAGTTRVTINHQYDTLTALTGKLDESFLTAMLEHANELSLDTLKAHMELAVPAELAR